MDSLKSMLIRHEGKRNKPYTCPAGKKTIGIGHNIDANPLPEVIQFHLDTFGTITDGMVGDLLDSDIERAEEACRWLYPEFDSFTETRQNALIDFLFNVGRGAAKTFLNTNRAINEGRWNDAAKGLQNSLWFRQVGNRSLEIVKMIREG